MLNSYEESGKEFGLTNKRGYLGVFLTFRVIYPIVAFIIVYFVNWLSLAIGDQILDSSGVHSYSSGSTDIVDTFYLLLYFGLPILPLYLFPPIISTVPLAGYRLEMIADPDENYKSRLKRSFGHLKVGVAFSSLLTATINLLPIAIALVSIPLFYLKYRLVYLYGNSPYITEYREPNMGVVFIVLLVLLLIATPITFKLSTNNFLVPYILAIDPKCKTVWLESKKIMKDHYKETSILYLRMLLLGIPSILLVIPLIWFIPYAYATLTYYALERLAEGGYVSYEADEETVNELDYLLQ